MSTAPSGQVDIDLSTPVDRVNVTARGRNVSESKAARQVAVGRSRDGARNNSLDHAEEDSMKPEQRQEDPAERELFETIKATYSLALEPEQHAMITELRSHLPTIGSDERLSLIDDIESSIGQNIEGQELEL